MSDQTENETPETEPKPRAEQYGWTRDGVTLSQLLQHGDDEAATEMMVSLLNEPRSLPIVFRAMAGLVGEALQAPADTPPSVFYAAVRRMLEDGQNRPE